MRPASTSCPPTQQNRADPPKHDNDHSGNQARAAADPAYGGRECVLDAPPEEAPICVLVDVSLYHADLVQGLVDVGAEIRDPVLACARQLAHLSPEEQYRENHQGHAEQDQESKLPACEEEHDETARPEHCVAQGHRDAAANHRFQQCGVGGESRNQLARSGCLEEPW